MVTSRREFLEGIPAIAKALGKSESTIWRWIHYHALPACLTPGGTWLTSYGLIDAWILARNNLQFGEETAKAEHDK